MYLSTFFLMPETKFRSFRVDAVVLRHSDYGEADRLLTLYTRQLGKTRALAKGARKIASRKAGHIEPFTQVKLQLAKGHDMLILTQADTVDAYQPLREDLILTSHASYVIELLDRFTYQDDTENSAIFRLLTVIMKCAYLIIWDSALSSLSVPTADARFSLKTSSSHSARVA